MLSIKIPLSLSLKLNPKQLLDTKTHYCRMDFKGTMVYVCLFAILQFGS